MKDITKEERSSTTLYVKDVTEERILLSMCPVAGLTEGETTKGWKSFSNSEGGKTSTLVKGSPSISGGGQIDPSVQEASHRSVQKMDNRVVSGDSKKTQAIGYSSNILMLSVRM